MIHYQLPRTTDTYVHRNGRTARAQAAGFALMLCAPDERKIMRAILSNLNRRDDLPDLTVEHDVLYQLKERVMLAREIDNAQHRMQKNNFEKKWVRDAANALDIEVDTEVDE